MPKPIVGGGRGVPSAFMISMISSTIAQLLEDLHLVIAMAAAVHQAGGRADIALILLGPFDEFGVAGAGFISGRHTSRFSFPEGVRPMGPTRHLKYPDPWRTPRAPG